MYIADLLYCNYIYLLYVIFLTVCLMGPVFLSHFKKPYETSTSSGRAWYHTLNIKY